MPGCSDILRSMNLEISPKATSPGSGCSIPLKDQGDYVLEHFKYLADQRMKTFNYYAIVVAAAISGSVAAFDKCPWQIVIGMGGIHVCMALIFFGIDIRNSRLVFHARQALMSYEASLDIPFRVIQLDQGEEHSPDLLEPKGPIVAADTKGPHERWGKRHPVRSWVDKLYGGATFTRAFNAAFILQLLCGVGLIAAAYFLKGPGASGH